MTQQRAQLRMLADYLAATRNEIAVDDMFLATAKLSSAQVGYLPRVPHWVGMASRWPALTRFVSHLARGAWLGGGARLFFLWEYVKFSCLWRSSSRVEPPFARSEGAILGLSTRVNDIVQPGLFPGFPRAWLTLPWTPQASLPQDSVEVPLLSLVTRHDLQQSFTDAMTSTSRMTRKPAMSQWVLQSYTAFRWFLVRRAVDRLSGSLVTTEHFDRWAVLADRSVREARRTSGAPRRLVVVQHGALVALDTTASTDMPSIRPPTRLSQVDVLHAYGATQEAAFRETLLTARTSTARLEVHHFSPGIELSGAESSPRARILFVGHPLCEQFQVEAYNALRERYDLEAYYKPHPKAPMSGAMTDVGWKIVDNPQVFPRVDLLASYPSTLVIEYEGKGVPASVHPLGGTGKDLPGFLARTQTLIESTARTTSTTSDALSDTANRKPIG